MRRIRRAATNYSRRASIRRRHGIRVEVVPLRAIVALKGPKQLLVRATRAPLAAPGVRVEQIGLVHLALVPGDALAVGHASGGHGSGV